MVELVKSALTFRYPNSIKCYDKEEVKLFLVKEMEGFRLSATMNVCQYNRMRTHLYAFCLHCMIELENTVQVHIQQWNGADEPDINRHG